MHLKPGDRTVALRFRYVALAITIMVAGASSMPAHAEDPALYSSDEDNKGVYSFSLENDFFAGKDGDYTNGARFSYFSPEDSGPYWLEKAADAFPFFNSEGKKRWGISVGQSIFTPDNIATDQPQPRDEPYAGWLYATAGLTSDTDRTLDTFEVTLGMVGPASYAQQTQEFVHHAIGYQQPNGWQYQLRNEPGIIVAYQRKWHGFYESSPDGWAMDITPSAGGELGNIFTDATVGAVARFGRNLPKDYGPPLIQPSVSGSEFFVPTNTVGWYFFTGLEGRAVARNIFLDGNTFTESQHVDKLPLVGGAQAGIAFTYHDTRLSYTHVIRTQEFTSQKRVNQYGAITLAVRY